MSEWRERLAAWLRALAHRLDPSFPTVRRYASGWEVNLGGDGAITAAQIQDMRPQFNADTDVRYDYEWPEEGR